MPPPIDVNFEYSGREFDFQIHQRTLCFGSAGEGQYFWMDGRRIRRGCGGPNFRPIVDLWWHAAQVAGEQSLIENQMQLVLAECYPLVNTAKAIQHIYIDAHLHQQADREFSFDYEDGVGRRRSDRTFMLPDDERQRLQEVAHSRSVANIRDELEGLFLGELPPANEMPAYQEAARSWIGNGITAFRRDGREGLHRYTETVDEWIRRLRRRGSLERVRRFLNMFSYECKVAFYACYASAWVGIIQWLQQNQPINETATRFMQMWHHQNRAEESWGVRRDVFCGQVLALHPLSAVVMTSPEHLEVIGRWFGHPEYDDLMATGNVAQCSEYWNVVATILIAAHEYDHARRHWEERRGVSTRTDANPESQAMSADTMATARLAFEDFAAARGYVCPQCHQALRYRRHQIPQAEQDHVSVTYECSACGTETSIEFCAEDIAPDSQNQSNGG